MSDYDTIKEQGNELDRLRGLLRATAMNLGRPDAEPEDVPGLALAITRQQKKTPWQRIRDAAERGTGVRLTSDDVVRLAQDQAIMWRAEQDDNGED